MPRTCTASTLAQLDALSAAGKLPTAPPVLVTAIWDAQHGKPISYRRERLVCRVLGLTPPREQQLTNPCPTCGIVHGEGLDCGGAAGGVLWVKPDQRIANRSKPRHRKQYYRPCVDRDIGEYMKECDIDVNAVLRWWINQRELAS